jgi:hypothetical protein
MEPLSIFEVYCCKSFSKTSQVESNWGGGKEKERERNLNFYMWRESL